jgi:carbon-monoxide dehydrogenase medium subunit
MTKPAPFDYVAADSLDLALETLANGYGDAVVLAGGQTLVPLLALRMSLPSVLVDINPLAELAGVTRMDGATRIGAITRQNEILRDPLVNRHVPGLAAATRFVGHHQTRNRGTIGGSLGLAEPAAEYPATALALGARIEVRSQSESRIIEADDYFLGPYTTALAPDEMIVAVQFPDWAPGTRTVVHEVARRAGDFALVGLVCSLTVTAGKVSRAGISWFGMGPTPMHSRKAEAAITGQAVAGLDLAGIAELAVSETEPFEDIHASAHYRTTVARRIFPRIASQALNPQAAA